MGEAKEMLPVAAQVTPPTDAAIEVLNLHYSYKRTLALAGVSFTVARRSIHGFVGPNGAGKTTLLKVLATLLRPRAGTARIFGLDVVEDYKAVRERIGLMPDHFSMYRQMTVFEYLDFFAAAYGMAVAERDRVIEDALRLTDMHCRRDDLVRTLSRGMQQRLSLARVLVHDPELLLLDEPASGLDPRARIELMEILKELRRMGKTVFISSHILSELALFCDSFTIIDRGKIKFSGPKRLLVVRDGPTRCYSVTLECALPAVEKALGAMDGVVELAKGDGDPNSLRVSFSPEKTTPGAVLRAILDNGGQVTTFQEESCHLNDAFMTLTEPGVSR